MSVVGALAFHRNAVADMGALRRRIDTAQQAIASGTRLARASDDPVASATLARIDRTGGDATAYAANRQVVADSLATADTALQSMAALFARARELSVQGRTGTLDAAGRDAIGVEMLGLHDQLVALANTTDGRGRAVFGGGGERAYSVGSDGVAVYAGRDTASPVPVEDGVTLVALDVGEAVFGRAFEAVRALGTALRSGSAAALPAASDALLAGEGRVTQALASTGGRAARLDLLDTAAEAQGLGRAAGRSALADTDITATIATLQQLLTTLQATQATYSRVSQLSLFDYLR